MLKLVHVVRPGGFAPPDPPPPPQRAQNARWGPRSPLLAGPRCPAPLRRGALRAPKPLMRLASKRVQRSRFEPHKRLIVGKPAHTKQPRREKGQGGSRQTEKHTHAQFRAQ